MSFHVDPRELYDDPCGNERALWLAVIHQALKDLEEGGRDADPNWFFRYNAGFREVCELAGMEVDEARRQARKRIEWRENGRPKREEAPKREPARYTAFGETLTVKEWAEKTGISRSFLQGRVHNNGWTMEQAISRPRGWRDPEKAALKIKLMNEARIARKFAKPKAERKRASYNRVTYTIEGRTMTVHEWAAELGKTRQWIVHRVTRGRPLVEEPKIDTTPRFTIAGRTQTMAEWCAECDITVRTVRKRMKRRKMEFAEALLWTPPQRPSAPPSLRGAKLHEHDGRRQTLQQWAEESGQRHGTLRQRMRRGESLAEALRQRPRNSNRAVLLELDGRKQTVEQWATECGMSRAGLRKRLDKGLTLAQALTVPRSKGGGGRVAISAEAHGTGGGAARNIEPNLTNFQDTE